MSLLLPSSGWDEGVCGSRRRRAKSRMVGGVGIAHATNAQGDRLILRRPISLLPTCLYIYIYIPPLLLLLLPLLLLLLLLLHFMHLCVCKATRYVTNEAAVARWSVVVGGVVSPSCVSQRLCRWGRRVHAASRSPAVTASARAERNVSLTNNKLHTYRFSHCHFLRASFKPISISSFLLYFFRVS